MKKDETTATDVNKVAPVNLTKGEFDPFELKTNQRDGELFPLSDSSDGLDGESPLDLSKPNLDEERFPLKSGDDLSRKTLGVEGEILPRSRTRERPRSPIRTLAIATVAALVLFVAWMIFGFVYTSYYNASLYSRFHKGITPEIYNEDFDFFLTLDGVTSPVVRSDKKQLVKSFSGIPMVPGTLTSREMDGRYTVTGSSKLLPEINASLVGKTVTLEGVDFTEEYTVTDVSREISDTADLIIYVGSSDADIKIISATKSTPSQ